MQSVTKIRTPLPRNSQRTDASSSHYYYFKNKVKREKNREPSPVERLV